MKRSSVSSSNLASVGYDDNNGVLEIEFNNSSVYQYFNVASTTYRGLMNATSHGQFFDHYIKKGGYRFKKISG